MNIWMMLLTVALTVETLVADYMIKVAIGHKYCQWLLAGAFIIWGVSVYGWYFIQKYERLSITGIVFSVVSLIGITLMGIFFFDEKLTTREWIGFSLALLATLFLGTKA
jgi:drug/metabolite transporter (DMT)-like permease